MGGLAVFDFLVAIKMRFLAIRAAVRADLYFSSRGAQSKKSAQLAALGVLFSSLAFVCVILHVFVWSGHDGTGWSDLYKSRPTGPLADNSYSEWGIVFFALLAMFVNSLQ